MNLTEEIKKLAEAYNELLWNNFEKCFQPVEINDEILKIIPKDILNVLVTLLGIDETKVWVCRNLKALDNNTVQELVKSEIGVKALKMFILSMPN